MLSVGLVDIFLAAVDDSVRTAERLQTGNADLIQGNIWTSRFFVKIRQYLRANVDRRDKDFSLLCLCVPKRADQTNTHTLLLALWLPHSLFQVMSQQDFPPQPQHLFCSLQLM